MSEKNKNQELTADNLTAFSDDEILNAAAGIIQAEELAKSKHKKKKKLAKAEEGDEAAEGSTDRAGEGLTKSEADLKGSEGAQDLAGPSGTQGPVEIQKLYNGGSKGTNMQEEQGTISMRGSDPKDRPNEEGGGKDADTQTGDAQDQGDRENRPLKKMGGQQPKDPGPEGQAGDHPGQTGDAQDQANEKENRPLKKMGGQQPKDPGSSSGTKKKKDDKGYGMEKGLSGASWTKNPNPNEDSKEKESKDKKKDKVLGSDMNEADKSGLGRTQGDYDLMKKSIADIASAVEGLVARMNKFETEENELQKSVSIDTLEVLAKSYNKKIRSLERENEDLVENTKKELDELKKSQKKLEDSLSKPARTRETVSNYGIMEKSNPPNPEGKGRPIFKSKSHVQSVLEDLRKEGKVSNDEVIGYNVSNTVTENMKRRLGFTD